MPKPSPSDYPVYFQRYIDQVPETDLITAMTNQTKELESFLSTISEEKSFTAYAEGKWSIKELLQHVIDTERIFCYRALCFARGEKANLPGFEEDDYAACSHANQRKWDELVKELIAVRHATELLFKSFTNEALDSIGSSNSKSISVASIGFIITGHFYHHKKILLERYL